MASLYQRFTGKINTNNSFPNPPEASHLLGQGAEGERPAESQQRPRLQHQHSRHSEDEDVRINLFAFSLAIFTHTMRSFTQRSTPNISILKADERVNLLNLLNAI